MHEASIGSSPGALLINGWPCVAVDLPWVMAVPSMVCRNDEDDEGDFSEEDPEELEEEGFEEDEEEEYEEYDLDEELDEDDEDWDDDEQE